MSCFPRGLKKLESTLKFSAALHPSPYTLHPTPYALHPTPYTLHPTYTLHLTPNTLHPTVQGLKKLESTLKFSAERLEESDIVDDFVATDASDSDAKVRGR